MNDPQVDGVIKDTEKTKLHEGGSNDSESNGTGQAADWVDEWEQDDTVLKPAHWWFASTACPLIAGTFGPMANAFNICAIVQFWRKRVPPGVAEDLGELIKDPGWLIGVNAVSLSFAVIANAALMLNMVGRVRFRYAQPITVVGFFMASWLLIALVSVASTPMFQLQDLPPGTRSVLSEAYYYACFAAGIYFVVAGLMVFTVYGAILKKYPKQFEITTSQRTLMMQTITLMMYLLVGAGVYTALEGWNFNQSMYWADFTLLTIGIGDDFTPMTHAGRSLVIPYTFGGILAVGLVISSIRSLLLEKGSKKLHARTVEKKRAKVYTIEDAEWGRGHAWSSLFRKGRQSSNQSFPSERERRRAEFHAMRRIHDRTVVKNRYRALTISTLNAAILWFIGALVFWECEKDVQGWTYFQSVYFSWVVLITLGYGDFQPVSNAGRAFFVFWSLLAIPTLTVLISDMSDTVVKGISEATNWVGSLTIAPGQSDVQRMRMQIYRLSGGRLFKEEGPAVHEQEGDRSAKADDAGRHKSLAEIVEGRLSNVERRALDEYCASSSDSPAEQDRYFYHFLLVKEVRTVLADTAKSPAVRYMYDEWTYFLRLLGHDEDDPSLHTRKYNEHGHSGAGSDDEPKVAQIVDSHDNPQKWSWLSIRSPLAGLGNEADWILQRLLNKLQAELHFQGSVPDGAGSGDRQPIKTARDGRPPFSIGEVRRRTTDGQAQS